MGKPAVAITLTAREQQELERLGGAGARCRAWRSRPSDAAITTPGMARYSCLRPLMLRPERWIGKCFARHRGSEFLKFLREIETNVPGSNCCG
jgi:hypothetical protein